MRKNRKEMLKTALYAVLVLLCVVIFIVFNKDSERTGNGKEDKEPESSTVSKPTKQIQPSPTLPEPTETLPYRLDVMLELSKWNIDCEISEPVTTGNLTEYELIFKRHTDTGRILLEVDETDHVTACTLERRYLYGGEPVVTGEVGDILRKEYERRRAADGKLINAFLRTLIIMLDYTDGISDKSAESIISDIISAYEDGEELECVKPPLRFFTETERGENYSVFVLKVSFDELTL